MRIIRYTGIALTLALSGLSAVAAHIGKGERVTFGPNDKVKDLFIEGGKVTLNGTYVRGKVEISRGGELTAKGAMIGGNIKADNADRVSLLDGTYAYKNVQVEDSEGVFEIYASSISGNVILENNEFEWIDIFRSDIYGKLDVTENALYDWIVVERIYQGGKQLIEDNEAFGILLSDNGSFEDVEVTGNYTDAETAVEYNLHFEDTEIAENSSSGLIFQLNEVLADVDITENFSFEPLHVGENWALYGNIKLEDNTALAITVQTNLIGVDLELDGNRGKEGFEVSDNVIDGDIRCQKNRPRPTISGNDVGGEIDCGEQPAPTPAPSPVRSPSPAVLPTGVPSLLSAR